MVKQTVKVFMLLFTAFIYSVVGCSAPAHAQTLPSASSKYYIDINGMLRFQPNTIVGPSYATESQMLSFARTVNPKFPAELPKLYLEVGEKYGIRGDVAFCQMIKETGYHRFGGDVRAGQYNYAGIGAVGRSARGSTFKSSREGVQAHIQHLYAYATKSAIPRGERILDPRFSYVPRGTAPFWTSLNGRWAIPGQGYGQNVLTLYKQLIVK
jgi:hypothetical protein